MAGRRVVKFGAAAFAIGVSLTGAPGAGVASADNAGTDASSTAASPRSQTGTAGTSTSSSRRVARSAASVMPAASARTSANSTPPQGNPVAVAPSPNRIPPALAARAAVAESVRTWLADTPAALRLAVPAASVTAQPTQTAVVTPVALARSLAAAAPVASVAAAAGSVSGVAGGLLGLLTGGDGGGSAMGPLAWAAVAVSRRQLGGAARTVVPAAAVVSTAQAAAAAAAGQPYVRSIVLPPKRTYGTDQTLTFTLKFSEAVTVNDPSTFTIPVQVGFAMRNAEYVRGSGTNSLVFKMKVTANDVGAIAVGRVSKTLQPGATAPARIFDFNGQGSENAPVANPRIVNSAGVAVSETEPTVDYGNLQVDARGPGVVSFGDSGAITTTKHLAILKVNFDQPVVVKGNPTVPVTVGGVNQKMVLLGGSGTKTLTFVILRQGSNPGAVSFGTNGQYIDLPTGADIKDRLGNSIDRILGNFGTEPGTLGAPLLDTNGDTMVALGTHFEKLGTLTADQLNTVMSTELNNFYSPPPVESGWQPFTANYTLPDFLASATPGEPSHAATHAVDLYRVAYESTIPEQGNRPTLAYGLVAIPEGTTGPLPIMSYQHGTIVGKGEVPSQSFNLTLQPAGTIPTASDVLLNAFAYETRLNVAQFGGQGYAVIAPDYFGVGNSTENDGYISKASQQQACLDMYTASLKLFDAQRVTTSDFFVGGWSQGGLVTVDFLEKLQGANIKVTGAATASAPANVQLTSNEWYFNPRYGSYVPLETPDAAWLNVVGELSNFSITGYAGYPDSALQMLGVNYEAARAMYMREYNSPVYAQDAQGNITIKDGLEYTDGGYAPVGKPAGPDQGIIVHRTGLADVLLPYNLQLVIAPQYSGKINQPAFSQTEYAQLLSDQGAGQDLSLTMKLRMYYGTQDEVIPVSAGVDVTKWQNNSFGNTNVVAIPVEDGNHRGTFVTSVYDEFEWFQNLRAGSTA